MAKKFAAAEAAAKNAANKSVLRHSSELSNVPIKKIIKVQGNAIVPLIANSNGNHNDKIKIIENDTKKLIENSAEENADLNSINFNFKIKKQIIKQEFEDINNIKDATTTNALTNLKKKFENKSEKDKLKNNNTLESNFQHSTDEIIKLDKNSSGTTINESKIEKLNDIKNSLFNVKQNRNDNKLNKTYENNEIQQKELNLLNRDKQIQHQISDDIIKKYTIKKKKLKKKIETANDEFEKTITETNLLNKNKQINFKESNSIVQLTSIPLTELVLKNTTIDNSMLNSLNKSINKVKYNKSDSQTIINEDKEKPLLSITERLRRLKEQR